MTAEAKPPQADKEAESWEKAQSYVAHLKRLPPVFTLAVRSLMSDFGRRSEGLTAPSLFLVNRLTRSPTMKAILYHSALTFHGDAIDNCPYLSSADMVRLYKPGDLAATIGVSCLYRTLRKGNASAEENPGFSAFIQHTNKILDIAGYVGYALPEVGAGRAIVAAAAIPLAQMLLYYTNPQQGEDYLSRIYQNGEKIDLKFEETVWETNSHYLLSCMLQKVGFGAAWTNGVLTALSSGSRAPNSPDESTHFWYLLYWLEILLKTGDAPKDKIPAIYYPHQKELHQLLYRAAKAIEKGSRYAWADKGKEDISPNLTPQLYQEYLVEAAGPEEIKEFCNKNISSELLEGLDEKDFLEITSKGEPADI